MTGYPAATIGTAEILGWTGIADDDAAACRALLAEPPPSAVMDLLQLLETRLGRWTEPLPAGGGGSETDWINAYLRFTPRLIDWHRQHGIPDGVSQAMLADLGRNLAINRRTHDRFGLDTWRWLTHHYSGSLYALGRLQYLVHPDGGPLPGAAPEEWVLGIHIPEAGPLDPAAVTASLAQAGPFFAAHFPEVPVRLADCQSWLLDPYLLAHVSPESNLAQFARRFTAYQEPTDQPTDAVYFTFRTRSMDQLGALPRSSSLQRLVLDRIAAGGTWQLGYGYLHLPG